MPEYATAIGKNLVGKILTGLCLYKLRPGYARISLGY